jgi:hypothetical protein
VINSGSRSGTFRLRRSVLLLIQKGRPSDGILAIFRNDRNRSLAISEMLVYFEIEEALDRIVVKKVTAEVR